MKACAFAIKIRRIADELLGRSKTYSGFDEERFDLYPGSNGNYQRDNGQTRLIYSPWTAFSTPFPSRKFVV
jgi:hypothetical protein